MDATTKFWSRARAAIAAPTRAPPKTNLELGGVGRGVALSEAIAVSAVLAGRSRGSPPLQKKRPAPGGSGAGHFSALKANGDKLFAR